MPFTHNSEVAETEPSWASVDKTALPLLAFVGQAPGTDPEQKSTWKFPHHFVSGETMYLHKGGLNAAWAAAHGARSGEEAAPAIVAHLAAHRKALGIEAEEKSEPRVIDRYKLLEPGHYDPHPHPVDVTAEQVSDFVDAINRKASIGVPVAIKYMHSKETEAIPVGRVLKAWLEGEEAWGSLEISMDAMKKGEIVLTVNQMTEGLIRNILGGSMEAKFRKNTEAYTEGREFTLWPSAYVILPPGVEPAVPPNIPIAAAEDGQPEELVYLGAPIRGNSPDGKGAEEMEFKEKFEKAEADLVTMTGEKDGVQTKLDASEKKVKDLEKADADRIEAEAKDKEKVLLETVEKKILPGKREEFRADLDKMDSHAARVQFLEMQEKILEDVELDPEKLNAGEAGGDGLSKEERRGEKQYAAIVEAAVEHDLNIDFTEDLQQATNFATIKNPDLFREEKPKE